MAVSKLRKVTDHVDMIKRPLFMGFLFIWHLLYFIVFFGLAYINESYIRNMSTAIQIFICVFLIIRFHPFREYSITPFDATVIFSSATFLLTNVITVELFSAYTDALANQAKGIFSPKHTEESVTPTPTPTHTIVHTYAPNATATATSVPATTSRAPTISNSTPDQEQSTKISYYLP